MSEQLRVVIADDEYLVREGARSVLSAVPGIEPGTRPPMSS